MSNQIGLYYLVCLQRSVCTINGRALNRTRVDVQGGIALRFAVNLQISCASFQFFFPHLQRIYPVRSLSGIVLLQILFLEKEENHSTTCVCVQGEGKQREEEKGT